MNEEQKFWDIIDVEFGDNPFGDFNNPKYHVIKPLPNIVIMIEQPDEEEEFGQEPGSYKIQSAPCSLARPGGGGS